MQDGHILLIDDDEDEYMIFLMALQDIQASNKCSYTKSIAQAFKLFSYVVPDLIFLDINMPGVNGLICLEQIKKIEALKRTLVFLYSNHMDDAITKRGLSLGATACIRKPARVGVLAELLKTILSGEIDLKTIYPPLEKDNERLSLSRRRFLPS